MRQKQGRKARRDSWEKWLQERGHAVQAPPSDMKHLAPRRPRGPSKLELELAGTLALMGLEPEREYRFHPTRRWRFDFAFPDVRLAVELNGSIFNAENGADAGRHSRGVGQMNDYEKGNAAAEIGWTVLWYGPPHVRSGEAALQIERIVRQRRGLTEPAE